MTRTVNIHRHRLVAASLLLIGLVGVTQTARAQEDVIRANIPFPFEVDKKNLPAGEYTITVDRSRGDVEVSGPKGAYAATLIETTMARPQYSSESDAHIVFDKFGGTYLLSEVWQPGFDAALVHVTKAKHEHQVIHIRKTT